MKTFIFGVLIFFISAAASALAHLKVIPYELVVTDQPAGSTIFVKRLVLTRAGYIVIRSNDEVSPSVSDYMPAGVYTDFNIDIVGKPLVPTQGMTVMLDLWIDNGDAYYDPSLEKPAKGKDGKTISQSITLY